MITNKNIQTYVNYYFLDKSKLPLKLRKIAIGDWDVSKVTIMSNLFYAKTTFNEPLNWTTTQVTDMSEMFTYCQSFNQPVNFDTSNVTNMREMFNGCYSFNQPVNFDTSNVTNMSGMFNGCSSFNQPVTFNTSNVTNMGRMFGGCASFNQPINVDTSNVTNMSEMFFGCSSFNQPINVDTSNVTNMGRMFFDCSSFNQPVNFDTHNVFYMNAMFLGCSSFNQPININTSNVTNMSQMFLGCSSFNQPVNIDTSKVTDMSQMFGSCELFNQPIAFNTHNVVYMTGMFLHCSSFNQPVNFDTSNVIEMSNMFCNCISFNQPLDFIVNSKSHINNMFYNCNSLTYYMPWDSNNIGNCPNFKQNKQKYIDNKYKSDYSKQKEISQRIKSRTYDFARTPAVTLLVNKKSKKRKLNEFIDDDSETNGYNPIERERTNISKWLENPENIIVSLNEVQYCISKTWIPNIIKQYTFIQCDETGKLLQQSVTASMKYINLNIIGIEPTCVVPYNEITELLSSSTNRYVLTDTGSKTAVTLEGIYENSTYKKYNPATDNVHKIPTAIYIPQQNYKNALTSVITDYTYKWDRRINAYLNSGKTKEEYEVDPVFLEHFTSDPYQDTPQKAIEMLEEKIKQLDTLFTDYSQTSNEELIVYRGVEVQSESKLRYGLNKAFVSTSTSIDVAIGFIEKTTCCLLELHVAPGIPFLSAQIFSKFQDEDEIILPRDLIYTFKGTKTEHDENIYLIDVTLSRENQFYQGWRCHDIPIYHLEPLTEQLMIGGLKLTKRRNRRTKNRMIKNRRTKRRRKI